MPQLSLPCPHCHAEKIGFSPRDSGFQYRVGQPISILVLQCEGCGWAIIAYIRTKAGANVHHWMTGLAPSPGDIEQIFPEHKEPEIPADIPGNVRKAFKTALRNLRHEEDANAAAIMFRRSIEMAVKDLNPDGKGNLKERIAQLDPNLATQAMKDWGDHVRLQANDATHEEDDFSKQDAATLHTFAKMFLTYAYTLPKALRRAKAATPELSKKNRQEGRCRHDRIGFTHINFGSWTAERRPSSIRRVNHPKQPTATRH
jgi:Domain of unknown function (DUF4145)